MSKKRAIILVLLLAVIGAGAAAYLLGGKAEPEGESVRTANVGSARATSTDSLVAEITATIYQIDRLKLDTRIFDSRTFKVLVDNTQVIPPQMPGRDNPFAPLNSDRPSTTTRPTTGARPPSTGPRLTPVGAR